MSQFDNPKKSEEEKATLAKQITEQFLALHWMDRPDVIHLVGKEFCFHCGDEDCSGVCQRDD